MPARIEFDEQDMFDILKWYNEGITVDEIAEEFGVNKRSIYKLLRSKGVLKEMGKYSVLDRWSQTTLEEFTKDYQSGMSLRDVGEKYDISSATIYNMLHRLGIRPRTITREFLEVKNSRIEQAVQYYIDGWELWRIIVETGIDQPRLYTELHRRGVRLRREYHLKPDPLFPPAK